MQIKCLTLLLSLCAATPFTIARADPYTFTTITVPGIPNATVRAINDAGQIVGNYGDPYLGQAYVDNLSSSKVTTFAIRGSLDGFVHGINNLGQVADTAHSSGHDVGYIYDSVSGTITQLPFPGGANGINDAGQIVGFNIPFLHGQAYGFVGDPATKTTIKVFGPGGATVDPSGLNNRGQVVGMFQDPLTGNFKNGVIVDVATGATTLLGGPGSSYTDPYSINDKGQVVGYFSIGSSSPNAYAFVFDSLTDQFMTLNVPGSITATTFAYGINNAGQIVGAYVDSSGSRRIFLATPTPAGTTVPEPGSLALLGGGLCALILLKFEAGRTKRRGPSPIASPAGSKTLHAGARRLPHSFLAASVTLLTALN